MTRRPRPAAGAPAEDTEAEKARQEFADCLAELLAGAVLRDVNARRSQQQEDHRDDE